ncbi:hypothetical protein IFM89_025927 [Coptis chinensis]|uniref:RNase H type-1 domain-containing protein n=1 Tax=Coptis chinensis TaxID=261450 RepID=A0A835LST5_9MAGN|nr:hypothetical protein IFM89_025927 [Coptis chinensis]
MVKLGKTLEFCNHCKGVGHSVVRCKFLKSDMEKGKEKEKEKAASKEKTVVILSTPVEESVNEDLIGEKYGKNRSQKKRWRKKKRDEATASGTEDGEEQVFVDAEEPSNPPVMEVVQPIPLETQGRETRAAAVLITGHSFNSITNLQILKTWNLNAILPRAPRIQPCWWTPPRNGIVKINCDGSSLDNLGTVGLGATYRIASGDFLLVIWRKIGVNTNYMAECLAILESVEVAIQIN